MSASCSLLLSPLWLSLSGPSSPVLTCCSVLLLLPGSLVLLSLSPLPILLSMSVLCLCSHSSYVESHCLHLFHSLLIFFDADFQYSFPHCLYFLLLCLCSYCPLLSLSAHYYLHLSLLCPCLFGLFTFVCGGIFFSVFCSFALLSTASVLFFGFSIFTNFLPCNVFLEYWDSIWLFSYYCL